MRKKQIEKQTATNQNNSIHIGSKHKGRHVFINEIIYLEANENYTILHLENGKRLLSSKPLKYYENFLKGKDFVRTHRSFLVQLKHIKEYEKKYRLLHLSGNTILSVSCRRKYCISKIIYQNKLQIATDKVA